MLTTIDHLVSLLSSAAIATAVVVLAIIRIPEELRWEPLSRARRFLVATFTILAISGLFKIDSNEPDMLSTVTLCVASYQALLLTQTASVMLTSCKSFHNTLWAFGFISLFTCLLVITKIFAPEVHTYVWYLAAAAYLLQLVIHTVSFRKQVKDTAADLENYYDANVDYHLDPIKKFFYSALGIGILAAIASLVPLHHWGYNAFVIIYTVYYVYVVVAIMNYCIDGDFFLAAAENMNDKASEPKFTFTLPGVPDGAAGEVSTSFAENSYEALEKALNEWVAGRGFTQVDVSTHEVAEHLCVTRKQLAAYFKNVHNTTFRSWRQRLRLEYAQCLIRECSDLQLAHLHEQVGFNDRSNFHNAFRKFTGMTPQEYRDSVK